MSFHIPVGISFQVTGYRNSSNDDTYRLLAPLERQIIMNLLWLESAIATHAMSAWVIRESKCEKYNSCS